MVHASGRRSLQLRNEDLIHGLEVIVALAFAIEGAERRLADGQGLRLKSLHVELVIAPPWNL